MKSKDVIAACCTEALLAKRDDIRALENEILTIIVDATKVDFIEIIKSLSTKSNKDMVDYELGRRMLRQLRDQIHSVSRKVREAYIKHDRGIENLPAIRELTLPINPEDSQKLIFILVKNCYEDDAVPVMTAMYSHLMKPIFNERNLNDEIRVLSEAGVA